VFPAVDQLRIPKNIAIAEPAANQAARPRNAPSISSAIDNATSPSAAAFTGCRARTLMAVDTRIAPVTAGRIQPGRRNST
jgi:hypothetical protein